MRKSYDLERLPDFQLLKDKVYAVIKGKILDLSFRPGEQLVEQRLAAELGISKSPIRDALQRLSAEGLAETIPYKGCYVAKISSQEFKQVFQLREALELFCLEQAFDAYTDQDIDEFRQIMDDSVASLREGDEYSAYNVHLSFHRLIVEKLGNDLISNVYSTIEDRLTRYLNIVVTRVPNRIRMSNEQHRRLFAAIENRNRNSAVEEHRNHLSSVLDDYLNRKEITDFLSAMVEE